MSRLGLSQEQQTGLRTFIGRRFTASALGLIGQNVPEEQISLIQEATAAEQSAPSETERKILTVLRSVRALQSIPDPARASLTPALLLQIHEPSGSEASGQEQLASGGALETMRVAPRIRAFCEWAAADSFRELNALEQAAIIILRLLEIRPFAEGNVAAALATGSLFTMRAGWPPIIIPAPIRPRFNQAVAEGLRMNTRPMVDLLAESIHETLESMIRFAKAGVERR